MPTDKIHTETY